MYFNFIGYNWNDSSGRCLFHAVIDFNRQWKFFPPQPRWTDIRLSFYYLQLILLWTTTWCVIKISKQVEGCTSLQNSFSLRCVWHINPNGIFKSQRHKYSLKTFLQNKYCSFPLIWTTHNNSLLNYKCWAENKLKIRVQCLKKQNATDWMLKQSMPRFIQNPDLIVINMHTNKHKHRKTRMHMKSYEKGRIENGEIRNEKERWGSDPDL